MRRIYDEVQLFLGIILSIPAIVSLIQNWHRVDFHKTLDSALAFYRTMALIVFGPVYALAQWLGAQVDLHFSIPLWVKDVHTLSFACLGIYARAFALAGHQFRGWNFWPAFLLIGISGLGALIIPFTILTMFGFLKGGNSDSIRIAGWATTLGVIGFYVTNGLLAAQ